MQRLTCAFQASPGSSFAHACRILPICLSTSLPQAMEPAAVSQMMQDIWDNVAPVYNDLIGDGMMAPATERIITVVKGHLEDQPSLRQGGPQF